MIADVVVVRLPGEALDDQAEDDVAGVRVALARARLELQRFVGEERQVVGELADGVRRLHELATEEVAHPRLVLDELGDGDLVGDGRRVIGNMLAHGVVERELAGRGELRDGHLREDLVDRPEVELRVLAVAHFVRGIRESPRARQNRLAVLGQQDHAGELILLDGAIDQRGEGVDEIVVGIGGSEQEEEGQCFHGVNIGGSCEGVMKGPSAFEEIRISKFE